MSWGSRDADAFGGEADGAFALADDGMEADDDIVGFDDADGSAHGLRDSMLVSVRTACRSMFSHNDEQSMRETPKEECGERMDGVESDEGGSSRAGGCAGGDDGRTMGAVGMTTSAGIALFLTLR